ncbi:MAG: integrase arm-type DNA-binding domain-containing protein [Cypionkella sp.]|uniref:tyrosine-type recombinase/integrase n=1 Tax=Cypionkella sp. TaxID=2811411 RepID=UPI002717640F|nr:site-specific integrase [Cypionkella sp.]MDO8327187.1 integrase arm-type DNA-binding domain-containing protein [Cypionkella sp.]
MAKALTAPTVEKMKADPDKRLEIPDGGLQGLYLVVQPTGGKTWAVRYRFAGKPAKLTLGRWPMMGVADARAAAAAAIDAVARGTDPAAQRKAEQAEAIEAARVATDPTYADRDKVKTVIAEFMKRHALHNRRASDVAAMFRREIIPTWGERDIHEIGKRDLIEVLDAIVDRGSPITANRLLAHVRTVWTWAVGRGIIAASPFAGIKPPSKEKSRDRVLTDEEIVWLWQACERLGQPFGALYRFLLLTGQRLREGAEMTEGEMIGNLWTIPAARVKNEDEHTLPISEAAAAVLSGVERIKGKAGYIFTTTGLSPVSGFTRAKGRLDNLMREIANNGRVEGAEPVTIPPFTIHDLRRTCASGMAGLRFPPHVVEAVLNHRSGTRRGVAGVYNRFDYADEKRQALEAWGRYVIGLVEGEANNVVKIRSAT